MCSAPRRLTHKSFALRSCWQQVCQEARRGSFCAMSGLFKLRCWTRPRVTGWLFLLSLLGVFSIMSFQTLAPMDNPGIVPVQQVSSPVSAPHLPHSNCPFGGVSQNSGTCASVSLLALPQSIGPITRTAQNSSRSFVDKTSALSEAQRSRLERPPRF